VGGTGATAGDPVIIADCTGAPSQQWNLGADQTVTSAANPQLCLNATAAGTANGTPINVWHCDATTAQSWTRT
jgi:hypothetical protein